MCSFKEVRHLSFVTTSYTHSMLEITPQQFTQLSRPAQKDTLYATQQEVQDFDFNSSVVDRFPDMIGRSVPGYWQLIDWIGVLSQNWIKSGLVYDLGTSLGAVAWSIYTKQHALFEHIQTPICAVDSSLPMIERLRANLNQLKRPTSIKPIHADVLELQLTDADLVCLNFTLQFIPRQNRSSVLTQIRKSLNPDGALILSEKVHFPQREETDIRQWHHQFKHAQGYSWLEIEQKAKSIELVMPTDTIEEHRTRLCEAGFSKVTLWSQALSFVSFVAEP